MIISIKSILALKDIQIHSVFVQIICKSKREINLFTKVEVQENTFGGKQAQRVRSEGWMHSFSDLSQCSHYKIVIQKLLKCIFCQLQLYFHFEQKF